MRFRAEQHLRRQLEIRSVREEGRRVECQAFTVWWKKRKPGPTGTVTAGDLARVCVVASTKAVGIAVQRNRAKRRLREVFRRQQHLVPVDCDLLLIARAAAATCVFGELERKFAEGCRRIPAVAAAPQ